MNKVHRIFRAMLMVYIGVLILTTVFAIGEWKFGHVRLLSVQTDSMVPTYRQGDALLVSPANNLRPGEIISYVSPKDPNVIISHRLLNVDNLLVTQGDNVAKPDVAFRQSLVVGQVRASLPRLGYGLDFIHTPIGLMATVYLPAFVLVASEAKRLSRHFGRGYYRLMTFR